jgi:hypothetical protein
MKLKQARNAADREVGPTLKRPYEHRLVLDRIKRLLAAGAKSSLWSLTHLCQFDILLASAQSDKFEEQQGGAQ